MAAIRTEGDISQALTSLRNVKGKERKALTKILVEAQGFTDFLVQHMTHGEVKGSASEAAEVTLLMCVAGPPDFVHEAFGIKSLAKTVSQVMQITMEQEMDKPGRKPDSRVAAPVIIATLCRIIAVLAAGRGILGIFALTRFPQAPKMAGLRCPPRVLAHLWHCTHYWLWTMLSPLPTPSLGSVQGCRMPQPCRPEPLPIHLSVAYCCTHLCHYACPSLYLYAYHKCTSTPHPTLNPSLTPTPRSCPYP